MRETSAIAKANGLARLVQRGDVLAKHDLHQLFTPLLRQVIAPFRRDKELSQDLRGQVYLIFADLVLKFEGARRASPILAHKSFF